LVCEFLVGFTEVLSKDIPSFTRVIFSLGFDMDKKMFEEPWQAALSERSGAEMRVTDACGRLGEPSLPSINDSNKQR
jgi:hypothetical protein